VRRFGSSPGQTPGFPSAAIRCLGLGACLALALASCSGGSKPPPERGADSSAVPNAAASLSTSDPDKVLNIYLWSAYVEPSVVAGFEKEYGIHIAYDFFDSEEVLETKLLTGRTNYDVVVPAGSFLERQIKAGVYQKLDRSLLSNWKNLDPEVLRDLALYDPGNQYAVDYTWLITTDIGYDVSKIKARMADAPVDSWRMLYDPAVVARFQDCGVSMLDSPVDVISTVLAFLGKDPNSESPEDLKAAEQVLLAIRPFVRLIDSSRYDGALASGEICLAMGWSGALARAEETAKAAGNGAQVGLSIPREGTVTAFDVLAIPADAPHPRNAHLFIDYLLRPEVAARDANATEYATPVTAAAALVNPELRNNPGVYPSAEVRAKLVPLRARSLEFTRLLNRTWTRFKTAR
jgi:putrescine transport system substrate-binding protein